MAHGGPGGVVSRAGRGLRAMGHGVRLASGREPHEHDAGRTSLGCAVPSRSGEGAACGEIGAVAAEEVLDKALSLSDVGARLGGVDLRGEESGL